MTILRLRRVLGGQDRYVWRKGRKQQDNRQHHDHKLLQNILHELTLHQSENNCVITTYFSKLI